MKIIAMVSVFLCLLGFGFESKASDFDLHIETPKSDYFLGEPVVIYVSLRNISVGSKFAPYTLDPEYGFLEYRINGNKFTSWAFFEEVGPDFELAPSDSLREEIALFFGPDDWVFKTPGDYEINAFLDSTVSNRLTITILAPRNEQEQAAANLFLSSKETGFFLLFESGDHLTAGIDNLKQVIELYPNTPHASYANQALGTSLTKDFANFAENRLRPENPEGAISYLEATKEQSPSFYHFSHTYLSLYEAYTKLGDEKQAQTILGDLVAITTEYREDFLPFLNDILKAKGLEEAARLALLARFNPRILIAKETGHNEIVIRDEKGELITDFETGTSGNDINVAAADFDGDGEDDIAINVGKQIKFHTLNGDEMSAFSIKKEGDIAAGDINGDGLADILTTSKAANTNAVSIYGYDGQLLKTVNIASLGRNLQLSVATADLDKDGKVEIIAGDLKGDQVAIYRLTGSEVKTFIVFETNTRTRKKPSSPGNSCSHSGKGVPKHCNTTPAPVSQPAQPTTQPVVSQPTPASQPSTSQPSTPSQPVVSTPTPQSQPSRPTQPPQRRRYGVNVAAGDLDGDGEPEIIVGMASKGSVVEIYRPDGTWLNTFEAFRSNDGVEITAGDINKDGKDEIIVGEAKGTAVRVFDLDGNQLAQFQGLDSKNIASIAFGKGAVEIVNPFPAEQPPVNETPAETSTPEPAVETPDTATTDGYATPAEEAATPIVEQPTPENDSAVANPTADVSVPDSPVVPDSEEASLITVSTEPPSVRLPPKTGEISGTYNYGGQTLTDITIDEQSNLSNATLAGDITNQGWLSNITLSDGATLEGGTVSGNLTNQGTVKDITFVGHKLKGGQLVGQIIINSDTRLNLGIVENVTLAADTTLTGGILKGRIAGNPQSKARIKKAKIRSKTDLSHVIIGKDCQVAQGVNLGPGVRFTENEQIPEETDLTAALSTNETIDINTDIVTGSPSLLTQINELPEMQQNDWQLVNADSGQVEVMVNGTRYIVIPKRVKQAKRNKRRAQLIREDKNHVRLITATGREIWVELEIAE